MKDLINEVNNRKIYHHCSASNLFLPKTIARVPKNTNNFIMIKTLSEL